MPTQCKLCGLHVPDGVQSCMMCGNKNLAVVTAGESISPSLPTPKALRSPGQEKFSSWLWAVAISLVAAPVFRVMSIINFQIPALYGDQNQPYVESHPGLSELLYFEILMNAILVASALALNFFFYTKRKKFPILMVAYVATTLLFLVATTAAMNSLFPDLSMTRSYVGLVRSLLWAGAMIPYLLTSSEIKKRFVN